MKTHPFALLLTLLPLLAFSQNNDSIYKPSLDSKKLLAELSGNACKCIDSINTGSKKKDEISNEIHSCIDKQTSAYQLGLKIANIKNLVEKGEKNITLEINTNPDSNDYKKYYYEIERHLVANCPSITKKIATNDSDMDQSGGNNSDAIKYYNLGLEESKKENFAKAIEYYKKAVVFDPEFAFAYDNLGVNYRRLNMLDEAIEAYEKSLKINPEGMMPLQNIAIAYLYKKEYKKAIKAYEKLAKVDDQNPEVFYGIGNIYAQYLFEYEKALENLCIAYNIYVNQKSPYRSDAEKLIQVVYNGMKKEGKLDTFDKILAKHKIVQD